MAGVIGWNWRDSAGSLPGALSRVLGGLRGLYAFLALGWDGGPCARRPTLRNDLLLQIVGWEPPVATQHVSKVHTGLLFDASCVVWLCVSLRLAGASLDALASFVVFSL